MKKRGKKVIYDVHEDFPINIRAKDYLPKIVRSAIAKVFEIYEKRKASRFDAVITVTPQIVERFQRYGAPTALVTNFPIVEDDLPKHERQDGIKILCFAGAVSPSRMHHVVVKAIQSMEGVCYQIAGKDTSQGAKYTDELKVLDSNSRLQLLGRLDRTDVLQLYERSTIGIALVDPDYSPLSFDGKGSIGATKLFEYMEAGLPLICQNYYYWKEIVESNHCGIAVDSRNVDEVARAIRYLLDHEEEALEMGRNGQKAILEKYNWESQEKALLDIYRRVEET